MPGGMVLSKNTRKSRIQTSSDLKSLLAEIGWRGYPVYKDAKVAYRFSAYVLSIDRIQGTLSLRRQLNP